jgi:hypothetical protein
MNNRDLRRRREKKRLAALDAMSAGVKRDRAYQDWISFLTPERLERLNHLRERMTGKISALTKEGAAEQLALMSEEAQAQTKERIGE